MNLTNLGITLGAILGSRADIIEMNKKDMESLKARAALADRYEKALVKLKGHFNPLGVPGGILARDEYIYGVILEALKSTEKK